MASGGSDRVRLWEMSSGKKVNEILQGGQALAFSPDGNRLACADGNRMVRLWDLKKGKELFAANHPVTPGKHGTVSAVGFFADGFSLASAGGDGDVRIWDTATGHELLTLRHDNDSRGQLRLSISPDGAYLASSRKNTIRVWNLKTGEAPVVIHAAQVSEVTALVFASDSRTLISGGHRRERVRDELTGKTIGVRCQAQIHWWDCVTGNEKRTIVDDGESQWVLGLVVQENRLFAALYKKVNVYELGTGKLQRSKHVSSHMQNYYGNALAVSPDGRKCVIASDSSCRLDVLELDDGNGKTGLPEGHLQAVLGIAFARDGKTVISGSSDGTVRLWDVASGRQTRKLVFSEECLNLVAMAMSPDGRLLAASGNISDEEGAIRIWDLDSGTVLRDFSVPEIGYGLAFSPDDKRLAVASFSWSARHSGSQRPVTVLDVTTGERVAKLSGPEWGFRSVHFLGQDRLLTVSDRVRTWDIPCGTSKSILQFRNEDRDSRFSPNGRWVAVEDKDSVTVWDVETGEAGITVRGHRSALGGHPMDFSPDGKRLVTNDRGGTFHVWDVATGKELLKLESPDARMYSFAFSPDGRQIATGMNDGTILLWDVSESTRK